MVMMMIPGGDGVLREELGEDADDVLAVEDALGAEVAPGRAGALEDAEVRVGDVADVHVRLHGVGEGARGAVQVLDHVRDAGVHRRLQQRAHHQHRVHHHQVHAALPRRVSLWTVPKGPFVHKKAQENFTRTTHARVIKVYDSHPHVVERWLHFCRIHAMPGLGQRAEVYR